MFLNPLHKPWVEGRGPCLGAATLLSARQQPGGLVLSREGVQILTQYLLTWWGAGGREQAGPGGAGSLAGRGGGRGEAWACAPTRAWALPMQGGLGLIPGQGT